MRAAGRTGQTVVVLMHRKGLIPSGERHNRGLRTIPGLPIEPAGTNAKNTGFVALPEGPNEALFERERKKSPEFVYGRQTRSGG